MSLWEERDSDCIDRLAALGIINSKTSPPQQNKPVAKSLWDEDEEQQKNGSSSPLQSEAKAPSGSSMNVSSATETPITFKAEYLKYKALYEEATHQIESLQSTVIELENELAGLKGSCIDTGCRENVDPGREEWERIAALEKRRKAKVNAKKMADSRKKGSKIRISASRKPQHVSTEEVIDTCQQPQDESVKESENEEVEGIRSSMNHSKAALLPVLEVRDRTVTNETIDWDSSDHESRNGDNGSDIIWSSEDEEPTAHNQLNLSSSTHIVKEESDEDTEMGIDISVKKWAQGKSIIDLLNSFTTVYHGHFPGLGNTWTSKFSEGALTEVEIRKAFLYSVRYCHPDKQAIDESPLIKMQAKKVFSVLSEAYTLYKEQL